MKKIVNSNPVLKMFKTALGGMLGIMSAYVLVGLYSLLFVGIGYYIMIKNNKEGTKTFEDLQPLQYVGIVLCGLGLLPWLQYLFFGFMSSAGSSAFDAVFD